MMLLVASVSAVPPLDINTPEEKDIATTLPVHSNSMIWAVAIILVVLIVALCVWIIISRMRNRNSVTFTEPSVKPVPAEVPNRYRALFENANDLIQGVAFDGRLLYANPAWHELLDYSEKELSSLTIFKIVSPECLEQFKVNFQRAIVGVKIKQIETTFVSKFGKKIIVEGSLHCESVDDRATSLQGIFRDVTARKRSESALKQSEERFSRVFAASPIAIAIITLDDGRIQDVNQSFLRMLGYSRNDTVGRTDLKLGFWAQPEERKRIIQKATAREAVHDFPCKLRSTNGSLREALVSTELIETNNEPCVLLMIYDNTERANLESQLRHSQKLEGVGQLAAGIAHDFNNILTIIQGHSTRIQDTAGVPREIRDSIAQVSTAADRAANLTRQLLTFCRKQAMVLQVIDINDTVRNVSVMLERILGEDIALDVQLKDKLPFINADSAMLDQILINLSCNSRDAMPNGGSLLISTTEVNVTAAQVRQRPGRRAGPYVRLTVTDTGSGMSSETLRRLFEPFFTTKEVGKGTGLGLATVYGIVDQHHGWIEVTSRLSEGTTFDIYLPETNLPRAQSSEPAISPVLKVVDSPAPAKATAPEIKVVPETPRDSRISILLVEDELALRELARLVLEDNNYRVLEAGSGVEALRVWEPHKHEIDMLLTDMVMPEGMTGRELAERLQVEKPNLRVLYSSGYSPDVVGGYFKLPENSFFLPKPYPPPKLLQSVRECLEGLASSPGAQLKA
jgi:two-component system, cell cycle sensor histidine kinase and response regulator CckA